MKALTVRSIKIRRLNAYICSGKTAGTRKIRQVPAYMPGKPPKYRLAASVLTLCILIMPCILGLASSDTSPAEPHAFSASLPADPSAPLAVSLPASMQANALTDAASGTSSGASSGTSSGASPDALLSASLSDNPIAAYLSSSAGAASGWDANDTTVYINLGNNGSISMINIVRRFENLKEGSHYETAPFESVRKLSAEGGRPALDNGIVSWETDAAVREYYYQGRLNSDAVSSAAAALPWSFGISYTLDGKPVEAEMLSGANGHLVITVSSTANEKASVYYNRKFLAQVTIPMDTAICTAINASEAAVMTAGSTKTLSFTLLPEMSASYNIEAQVENFKMGSIDIIIMEANLAGFLPLDSFTDAFGGISAGLGGIISGTGELKSGITVLSENISRISRGLSGSIEELGSLQNGLEAIYSGFAHIALESQTAASASSDIYKGIETLSSSAPMMISGYKEIENSLSLLLSNKESIIAAAKALAAAGPDPASAALARSVLVQLEALSGIYENIKILNSSLAGLSDGMAVTSSAAGSLSSGLGSLSDAMASLEKNMAPVKEASTLIVDAARSLSQGIEAISAGISILPDAAGSLLEGQKAVESAIAEITDAFSSMFGTGTGSTSSETRISTDTLQFLLRTPTIGPSSTNASASAASASSASASSAAADRSDNACVSPDITSGYNNAFTGSLSGIPSGIPAAGSLTDRSDAPSGDTRSEKANGSNSQLSIISTIITGFREFSYRLFNLFRKW